MQILLKTCVLILVHYKADLKLYATSQSVSLPAQMPQFSLVAFPLPSAEAREGGCGNALSNGLEMIVSCVELNTSVLGELSFQHLLGGREHDISAFALAYTPEDHYVINLVELAILGECVSEVDSDRLI